MSGDKTPVEVYTNNSEAYNDEIARLKARKTAIGWLRLLVVVAAIVTIKLSWYTALWIIAGEAVCFIAAFLYVVSLDTDVKQLLLNAERLLQINKDELAVLNFNFQDREEGMQFAQTVHNYANDLDIFGPSSIYQYINRCTSEQGKQALAEKLLEPAGKETIVLTQEAVKELSGKTPWRQQMQAFGMAQPLTKNTEKKINDWFKKPRVFGGKKWCFVARIFPVLSLSALALYVFDVIPAAVFWLLVFCFLVIAFSISKKIHATWLLLSKIVEQVDTVSNQLAFIEEEAFKAALINKIQNSLQNAGAEKASVEIKNLKAILNRFDVRLNTFAFLLLNTFLLWDLWQLLYLDEWKEKNAGAVANWFSAVAAMETLSSLATLAFNQPQWCFPAISDKHFTFEANELGHPLIPPAKRVNNSFALKGVGKVSIVTGSNMGGKSTFLRS
ncbi:MAG TPA: hypothetical protein VHB48_10970, partial [Chitinophagaceae bacterium]|nr:hypothetical protein [Chitinophagaceae bacterium]